MYKKFMTWPFTVKLSVAFLVSIWLGFMVVKPWVALVATATVALFAACTRILYFIMDGE